MGDFCLEDRKSNIKAKDVPLRKRQGTSKTKTVKMNRYLMEKAEKARRKNSKLSSRKGIKHDIFPSDDGIEDDLVCNSIQEDLLRVILAQQDANEDDAYRIHDSEYETCDSCREHLPDEVKFYYECEQKFCAKCLEVLLRCEN